RLPQIEFRIRYRAAAGAELGVTQIVQELGARRPRRDRLLEMRHGGGPVSLRRVHTAKPAEALRFSFRALEGGKGFRRIVIAFGAEKRFAVKLHEVGRLLFLHRILIEIGERGAVAALLKKPVHHAQVKPRCRRLVEGLHFGRARRNRRYDIEIHAVFGTSSDRDAQGDDDDRFHFATSSLPASSWPAVFRASFRFTTAGPARMTRRTGMKNTIMTMVR